MDQKTGRWDCIISFSGACLIALLGMCIAGIFPGGDQRAVNTDTMDQVAAFSQMLVRQLMGGDGISYSFDISMGQSTALLYAYYTSSPFTLLYFLISDAYFATIMAVILKIGFTALFFHRFLQYMGNLRREQIVFFSLCYALCGYQLEYMLAFCLMDAMYMLPLVMLSLFKSIDTGRVGRLSVVYAFSFVVNCYSGFLIGLFSFFSLLGIMYLQEGRGFWKKKACFLVRYLIAVVLAVFISMISLLSAIQYVLTAGNLGQVLVHEKPLLGDILYGLYFGRGAAINTEIPFIYCGIPVMLLLPAYFTDASRPVRERGLLGVALLSLMITIYIDPLYYFLHVFSRPDGYSVRYAFLYVFLMVVIAARAVQNSNRNEATRGSIIRYICIQLLLCVVVMALYNRYGEGQENRAGGLVVAGNLLLILLWGGMGWLLQKKKSVFIGILIFGLLFIELGVHSWRNMTEQGVMSEKMYSNREKIVNRFVNMVIKDSEKDGGVYRAELVNSRQWNENTKYGYAGIGDFVSFGYPNLHALMRRLGDNASAANYTQEGATDLTDMLFGVRYRGQAPQLTEDEDVQEGIQYEVYDRALPFGYMVSAKILDLPEWVGNPFENQNMLLSYLCGRQMQVYKEAESFGYTCSNSEYKEMEDGYWIYNDGENVGSVLFGIPVQQFHRAYAYFQLFPFDGRTGEIKLSDEMAQNVAIYSADDRKGSGGRFGISASNAIMEMTEDEGAFVILFANLEEAVKPFHYVGQYFCYQDDAVLEDGYRQLSQGGWKVEKYTQERIEALVEVNEDMPILFISVPYDKGWHATVDGKETEIFPLVADTFMGIYMTPGVHSVVLEYRTPGRMAGILLSAVGILGLVLLELYTRKYDNLKWGHTP